MKKVTLKAGTGSSRATTLSVGAAHGEAVLADRERRAGSLVKQVRGTEGVKRCEGVRWL